MPNHVCGGGYRLSQVLFADQLKQVQDQEKDELLSLNSSEKDQMVKQLASTETEMSSLQAELGELNSALAMSKVKHLLNSNKHYVLVSLSCLLVLQEGSTNLEVEMERLVSQVKCTSLCTLFSRVGCCRWRTRKKQIKHQTVSLLI